MLLPAVITMVVLAVYILVMFFFFTGVLCLKGLAGGRAKPPSGLTVIIPYRNEVAQLPGIIADLVAQTYPSHLFSVFLVNDHSTDGSAELLASLTGKHTGFRCLDLPGGLEGKKDAIAYAVSLLESPWILQTDADCRVGPSFIASHMNFLAEHPCDLVAGLATIDHGQGGFLEAFERLDLLALNGSGAGSFYLGRPMMCSGANLLYSRDLYNDTREFDPVGKTSSGDDMFLLIGARKLHRKMTFNPDKKALVRTKAVGNPASLIRQRIRWGAKSAHYGMADIQALAVLVASANLLMLLSTIWMIMEPRTCSWLLPVIGGKLLVDFLVLAATSMRTGQIRTLGWYLPVALVYPAFIVIVVAGSLFSRPNWKGRNV